MKTLIAMLVLAGVAHAEEPKCVVEKPVVTAPAVIKAPPCHRATAKLQKAITAEIVKAYMPERSGTPAVKYPCDGLGAKIHEIVVETGGGHGGGLELWRARRRSDGKYDARGIIYRGSSMTHKAAAVPHTQASGIVELPALDTVRAAMTATVREVVPRANAESLGTSTSVSSRDFHVVLRLVDDQGRVALRRYTGYASSSSQNDYLGLQVAERALDPITALAPNEAPADQDDRAFFAASFNAAVPHFDDTYFWWVMERYVDLARFLGTPAVIPGLLTRMTVPAGANRSKVDARTDALDALARITGWDARKGKSVEDAAKAYLAACK